MRPTSLPPLGADVLALLAGLSLPLAFAPFNLTPLAILAPAALFALWKGLSPSRAFLRGWLFGLGMFGIGVSWVHESFQYSNVGAALAVGLTAVLIVFLALFPATLGYLVARLFRGSEQARLLLVYPAGWVLTEWVRGWFLTGFTWLQLGYSQIDSPLGGFAPLVGVYGVSWVTALLAGGLVRALCTGRRGLIVYTLILVALLITGYGIGAVPWTKTHTSPLSVALVQGNVPQDLKWHPDQRRATLERYLKLTRAYWDADLVVWPESALPGFYHEFVPAISRLTREARDHGTDILLGIDVLDPPTGRYFNSILVLGTHPSLYHKRHLVPFVEYLPLEHWLRPLVEWFNLPVSRFSKGSPHQPLASAAQHLVGLSVCYEIAFGEEIIETAPEAALLVNVSNDAWFGDSIGPHQHLEIARMRAIETGRYLARATNTGITAIIAPNGKLKARIPQFETRVLTGEVFPTTGTTPYARWGNLPVLVGIAAALAVAVLAGIKRL